jgi:2-phospho-L-lactate guanylyltransferase
VLDRVIGAAGEVAPVSVVTADAVVAAQAKALGADVIEEAEVLGLNAAALLGVGRARTSGETTVMILAADLPDLTAEALRTMVRRMRPGAVVIGPSRDGGTNALILSARLAFRFAYGPDSFARHRDEAERLGLEVVVEESAALSVDIDWPGDLADHRDLWAA